MAGRPQPQELYGGATMPRNEPGAAWTQAHPQAQPQGQGGDTWPPQPPPGGPERLPQQQHLPHGAAGAAGALEAGGGHQLLPRGASESAAPSEIIAPDFLRGGEARPSGPSPGPRPRGEIPHEEFDIELNAGMVGLFGAALHASPPQGQLHWSETAAAPPAPGLTQPPAFLATQGGNTAEQDEERVRALQMSGGAAPANQGLSQQPGVSTPQAQPPTPQQQPQGAPPQTPQGLRREEAPRPQGISDSPIPPTPSPQGGQGHMPGTPQMASSEHTPIPQGQDGGLGTLELPTQISSVGSWWPPASSSSTCHAVAMLLPLRVRGTKGKGTGNKGGGKEGGGKKGKAKW